MTKGRLSKAPVRLMLALDTSYSMNETFGTTEGNLTKLERVKVFATLLVRQFSEEYSLGIVSFGTTARIVSPLRKMTAENKEDAVEAISKMEAGGVTNISAGLFLAQDQFVHITYGIRAKGPAFDDNLVLFTDGQANEGITNCKELLLEFRTRTGRLQQDYRYPEGYRIRLATLGTGGFMPDLIYSLSQKFSSDPFYYLDSSCNLELNMFRAIYMRSVTFVHRIQVRILALNGCTLSYDGQWSTAEFIASVDDCHKASMSTEINFFIYDIAEDSSRHLPVQITLPVKHKKKLKGLEILQLQIRFQDRDFRHKIIQKSVNYEDVPKKPKFNTGEGLVYIAKYENRIAAVTALNNACDAIARLNRSVAKESIRKAAKYIQNQVDLLSNTISDEALFAGLSHYSQPILDNLAHAEAQIDDMTVKFDDLWGRMRALGSSLARESPTCVGVYAPGAHLYDIRDMQKKMGVICTKLREYYKSRGLNTQVLDDQYHVISEMERRWNEVDHRDNEGPIVCFNLKIN